MTQTPNQYQSVSDFYSGRSVFITGATGFLGKAYVEKLAYECRQIDKIYILIRHKKDLDPEQRIKNYLDQPFFMRIRKRPEAMKKIIPVFGDITSSHLGLTDEDQQILIDTVSVVIHCAAAVKFNQVLKDAIHINVEGTRNILNLTKLMKNACVFVYVSTAYSNSKEKVVEEIVYPPPADLEEVKKIAMRHYISGDGDREILQLIKGHPNTYTFSKALAEQVVANNHGHLAAIIVRPAIISAAEKEPVAGWIDNLTAATGMVACIAKGWMHAMLSTDAREVVLDLIPLDYVVNLTIVAASRVPLKPGVTVYHSCTSSTNPITLMAAYKYIKEKSSHHDISESPFNVSLLFSKHKAVISAATCLMQTMPAFIADVGLRCKGERSKYVKLQAKVVKSRDAFNYFTTNTWKIRCEGARSLSATLNPQDRERFRCDPMLIDWREYMFDYQTGIERHLSTKKKEK